MKKQLLIFILLLLTPVLNTAVFADPETSWFTNEALVMEHKAFGTVQFQGLNIGRNSIVVGSSNVTLTDPVNPRVYPNYPNGVLHPLFSLPTNPITDGVVIDINSGDTDNDLLGFGYGGTVFYTVRPGFDGKDKTANQLFVKSASKTLITFTGTGFVGVGSTAPSTTLEVNGNMAVAGQVLRGLFHGQNLTPIEFDQNPAGTWIVKNFAGTTVATYGLNGLSKNFIIQHPQNVKKYLIHASLEGPENAVFYKGKASLKNGRAMIQLPNYFEALTRKEGRTIILTAINGFDGLAVKQNKGVEIHKGKFEVYSNNAQSTQTFYWEVKAVRGDVALLKTEVNKNAATLKGYGPYTYLEPKK